MKDLLKMSQDDVVIIALSFYLGEQCKYCGKEYQIIEDLDNTVWAGYHSHGRLACKQCWTENND